MTETQLFKLRRKKTSEPRCCKLFHLKVLFLLNCAHINDGRLYFNITAMCHERCGSVRTILISSAQQQCNKHKRQQRTMQEKTSNETYVHASVAPVHAGSSSRHATISTRFNSVRENLVRQGGSGGQRLLGFYQ